MTTDADLHESLRILSGMRARRDRIDRAAAADHALVDAWRARQLGDLPDRIALAEDAIGQMATEYTANRKAKTVSTPWGSVATRTTTKWAYDDDAALDWARTAAPELIVTPPPPPDRLDKVALKAAAITTNDGTVLLHGEIVPGVTAHTVTTAQITTTPALVAIDDDTEQENQAA